MTLLWSNGHTYAQTGERSHKQVQQYNYAPLIIEHYSGRMDLIFRTCQFNDVTND